MDNADCEELKQLRVTCKAFQSIRELGDDYRHERSPYASTQLGAMQSLRRNLPSSPDPAFETFGQEFEVLEDLKHHR